MCTAVRGVGPPAGKLTLWSIICDKAPVGEARRMALIACGCSSESHPFNGVFMAWLSDMIFEWDPMDYW